MIADLNKRRVLTYGGLPPRAYLLFINKTRGFNRGGPTMHRRCWTGSGGVRRMGLFAAAGDPRIVMWLM